MNKIFVKWQIKSRNPIGIDTEYFKATLPKRTWIFKGKITQGFKVFLFMVKTSLGSIKIHRELKLL